MYFGSLVFAAESCHNNAVFEMALRHGANPNSREWWDSGSDTLLIHAASEGNLAHAKMLLRYGADVKARGSMKQTALINSVIGRPPHQREMLALLLDAGADINATDECGSALTELADDWRNNLPLIHFLLARGANPDARDDRQRTALFFAVGRGNLEHARELLSHGADVNATDRYGITPYCLTGEPGPMRRLLRKAGAKPKRKSLPRAYWS